MKHILLVCVISTILLTATCDIQQVSAQSPQHANPREKQEDLAKRYGKAILLTNLQEQRMLLAELKKSIEENDGHGYVYSGREVTLAFDELDRVLNSSDEVYAQAKQQQHEESTAIQYQLHGDLTRAIAHHKAALNMSYVLYGNKSYHSLTVQTIMANAIFDTGKDLATGIALLQKTHDELKSLRMTDGVLFCQTTHGLFVSYLSTKDYPNAFKYGIQTIEAHKRRQSSDTDEYLQLVALLAKELNKAEQFKDALTITQSVLDGTHPKAGLEARFSVLIYREYATAKVGLGDYTNVSNTYSQAIVIANRIPGYPASMRLDLLKEFLGFAKSRDDQSLVRNIEQMIDKIESRTQPTRSRYSDPPLVDEGD